MENTKELKTKKQCDIHVASNYDYYWMINTKSYSIDGIEVSKGQMVKKKKGERAIVNTDWRKATAEEVSNKKYYKGHYFNLRHV